MHSPDHTAGRWSALALAAAKGLAALLGTFAFVLIMAGLPLLFSDETRSFTFAPMRVVDAALSFLRGLGDGSVFVMRIGGANWDFRELGLHYLRVSLLYTAIPGAIGLGLGGIAGIASRRRGRAAVGRLVDLVLATPDFLVIFMIQGIAAALVHATGLKLALGAPGGRLAVVPALAMGLFPFLFAWRASVLASRRAEGEEFIAAARARGIPEGSIATRHLGAVVIPLLEAELPVLMAFMQGSLFVTEQTFVIPGMARYLYQAAFQGGKRWVDGSVYQYGPAVLAMCGLVASCVVSYLGFRLALAAARKVLTHE